VAVGALNTGPVGRLGTVAASVAELVAVTALDLSHVLRLRALLRHVALLVTVAAGHDTLLVALLSTMTLLTAVAAEIRLTIRAVAGEMTHLAAVLALNIIHVGWLRALLRHVAILTTVAATTATLLQRLLAVASAVANLVAVDALLDDLLRLTLLLLTVGSGVADLFAVLADDDEAVHGEASLTKAVDVLLRTLGPALGEDGTPRLGGPLDGDGVLLVGLTLKIDESPVDGNLLLLRDQVSVELFATEGLLEVLQGSVANRLGVGEECLYISMLVCVSSHIDGHAVAYLLDSKCLLLLVRSLESLPSIFRGDVAHDTVEGEKAVGVAISSDMALGLANTAGLGSLVRAVGLAVARLATATALASELALNPLVRAVGSVVARLVAVVAEARVVASLSLLGTVASEVALTAAARTKRVSRVSKGFPELG